MSTSKNSGGSDDSAARPPRQQAGRASGVVEAGSRCDRSGVLANGQTVH
jgi:hypothetical protein